jgi:hypothetical protein
MRLRASARHLPTVSLALGAVAALALAGCGTVVSAQGFDPTAGPTGSTAVPVTSVKSPGRPTPTPTQRAEADADSILASFAVPKGARRLSAAPAVGKGVLKTAPQVPSSPDLVDKAEWWITPGAPQTVLAWEEAHVPHRFSAAGTSHGYQPGFADWSDSFALPEIPAVLDSRELSVMVVQDGDKTAIRVDAQVTWQPARPATEKVPAAAKAVTITMKLGLNQGGRKPPKPVTITDRAKVNALKALINGLTLFPPGRYSCPADFGDGLVLTFSAGPRTPALAVATIDLAGCDAVGLSIGGKSQPALSGPGTDSGAAILKTAGLSWKIPSQ